MDVKPSVVMITGANRGIGRAIADRFYADGAQLALGVRDPAGFLHPYAPQRCLVAPTDVRSEPALQAYTEATLARFGRIDVLVNNAGVDEPQPLSQITAKHLHDVMSVNFYAAVLLTKLVSQAMIAQGAGTVINISSIAGKEGTPHHIAYTASKHALLGFTKCAARELIGHGITVNAVCPGLVDTRMLRTFFERLGEQTGASPDRELQAMIAKTPRGEVADPADVACLVTFLASPGGRNIVGQAINTDGGLLQW